MGNMSIVKKKEKISGLHFEILILTKQPSRRLPAGAYSRDKQRV